MNTDELTSSGRAYARASSRRICVYLCSSVVSTSRSRMGTHMGPPLRPRGRDEGVEDLRVAGADGIFGVPLHAQAEAVFRVLDAFDHAVFGEGVHHHAGAEIPGRLMMGAVDLQFVGGADAVEEGALHHFHAVAGFGARIRLLVGERAIDLVGNVLDERAAEDDVQQLLAAADAEHRLVALERALGDRQLEGGALFLGLHCRMAGAGAEDRGVDVEGAAGDDEAVELVEIAVRLLRLVREQYRQATGAHHRLGVVLPQRVPGQLRIAAGLFGIEGDADDGLGHADGFRIGCRTLSPETLSLSPPRKRGSRATCRAAALDPRFRGGDTKRSGESAFDGVVVICLSQAASAARYASARYRSSRR